MRALVYVRNSSGSIRSVDEQEAESRALCERNGWTVERVVSDLVGASRHSKGSRKGWSEVKRLLPEHDVLVTWEASRAQRDLADYAELRDLCVENGVLWCYSGRVHDLTTADGQFRTGLDALLAERETNEMTERIKRAMRANAAAGKPHGRRPFGYHRVYDPTSGALVRQEPHPTEAPVVREVFARYLSGQSMRTIADWLEAEGIATAQGNRWSAATVGTLLARPTYAGRRQFQGQVVGEGNWPALVDDETFDQVQARRLSARTWTNHRRRSTARMLTGIARCGVCSHKLRVGHDRKIRDVYICGNGAHVARDLKKLDAYVGGEVRFQIDRLRTAGFLDATPSVDKGLADQVRTLRARLDDAIEQFTAGTLTAFTLAKVEAELAPAIAKAEAEARASVFPLRLDLPDGDLEGWWNDLTPEVRREVAAAVLAGVVVNKVGSGTGRWTSFNEDAIDVEFRW